MSKTIKTLLLISILISAFLQSASSQKLRSLQEDTSHTLIEDPNNAEPENDNSDGFVLGEGDEETAPADHAANYDLGEVDAASAPAPTSNEIPVGASVSGSNEDTSFVLGDEDETQSVSNTRNNAATTVDSHDFDLGDEAPVGASPANDETSFELKEDVATTGTVGTGSDEGESFDLKEDDTPVGTGADEGESFDLKEDDANTVGTGADEGESFELKEDDATSNNVGTGSNEGESFDLKEDDTPVGTGANEGESFDLKEDDTPVGTGSASNDESFDLVDNDNANGVDLTDPADESSSTDKNSGADSGERGIAPSADVSQTVTTSVAKSGVSLQTGFVIGLVAVVSALVL